MEADWPIQRSWHYGVLGEMTQELDLVSRHILGGSNALARFQRDHSIDHDHGEPLF
jgi:hypothetical protein